MKSKQMNQRCVNIACGASVVSSWLNLDFSPVTSEIKKANLLGRLPLADQSIDVCYSSHFIEHIPRKKLKGFLTECYRILAPGGRIRLVMPDLEEMCREYLTMREAGEHEKADFLVLEILDQCVRQEAGGELGQYYRSLSDQDNSDLMSEYVKIRTGENLDFYKGQGEKRTAIKDKIRTAVRSPGKFLTLLQWSYSRALSLMFPAAFRQQNISFASVGERHMWIYDFHTLAKLLQQVGFVDIEKLACNRTHITDFPLVPLDMYEDGSPRKGRESMYIEAKRPNL